MHSKTNTHKDPQDASKVQCFISSAVCPSCNPSKQPTQRTCGTQHDIGVRCGLRRTKRTANLVPAILLPLPDIRWVASGEALRIDMNERTR